MSRLLQRWVQRVFPSSLMKTVGDIFSFSLLQSLRQLGLYHVLYMYVCGLSGEGAQDLSEYQYEAAWRCTQWGEGGAMTSPPSRAGKYHETLYSCLRCLKDGEKDLLNRYISDAR